MSRVLSAPDAPSPRGDWSQYSTEGKPTVSALKHASEAGAAVFWAQLNACFQDTGRVTPAWCSWWRPQVTQAARAHQ